jgi:hypothetical protein
MKTNRLLFSLFLFAACASVATVARAANAVSVRGILISASNESGESDQRLAAFVPNLKRILRFESFRFLGEDSASVAVPASGRLSLGKGHSIELTTESSDGKTVLLKVYWPAGHVQHEYVLQRGVPTILGGPSTGNKGEVYAVILVGR